MGKITKTLNTQYTLRKYHVLSKLSLCRPMKSSKGLANLTALLPVRANTIKIRMIDRLESIPQRCFKRLKKDCFIYAVRSMIWAAKDRPIFSCASRVDAPI